MPRILGIGDNTVDIYVDQGAQYPGGNAVNVAVLAARCGARASYLGCLGTDARGDLLYRSLAAEGVDLSRCRRRPGANAWSRVGHRRGDRVFLGSNPGVRAQYALGPEDEAYIAAHDLAHTSIHSDLEAELPRLRRAAPVLSMDLSEHVGRPTVPALLPLLDIAFASAPVAADEACQALAERLAASGPRLVVVTRGPRGAVALADGRIHWQGVVPVDAVDTLGAGDAFIAAFLVAHLDGAAVPDALAAGARCAAQTCTYRGAYGHGVPWRPEPADEIPAATGTGRNS